MKSIILSIHSKWAQEIYARNKIFEFRRVFPAREIRYVFLYETDPVQKITGVFRPGSIFTLSCGYALNTALRSQKSGMTIKELLDYKGDREFIKAITVLNPRKLKKSLNMSMAVPQNFRYISNDQAGAYLTLGFGMKI